MATTTANKSKGSNGTNKSTRKPTASRSQRASAPPRNSEGRFRSDPSVPAWAATIASIVGVGVAVGAGLYATRRQWLPQAERWGDQIASRFRTEDEDDFYGDSIADRDDDEIWEEDENAKVSRAAYPDRDLYPAAQPVS